MAKSHKYSVVQSSSVRYANVTKSYPNTNKLPCLALCDLMDGCSSVNHNSDTHECELTSHVPSILAPEPATASNWRVYYNDRFIHGVDAWQASTYYFLSSNLAIDGNYKNYIEEDISGHCAHTNGGSSSWTMELERVADVSYVRIYFRNQMANNFRNTNIRLLISETKEDSDNNIGTDCANYVGPPESPALPVKVTCTQPVTGKFLKLIRAGTLTLCEVEVYSV
ncbi:uncharacterized protein LOC128547729 [Mercenaria mercenaria]|uniref:uncharacterized protein LOC128547729 n=1 Tax=Mercenaria mercenaria TaxID=6596 RepID=UPI00234F0568|nr:uncharacterized protein LOC128547729 [Mercenaria mercenaria]